MFFCIPIPDKHSEFRGKCATNQDERTFYKLRYGYNSCLYKTDVYTCFGIDQAGGVALKNVCVQTTEIVLSAMLLWFSSVCNRFKLV